MGREVHLLPQGSVWAERYRTIQTAPRGQWFTPEPEPAAMPPFDEVRSRLPGPYIDGRPDFRDCYDFCVDVLFRNRREPDEGSPLVTPFLDAAFNGNIFFWDTAFITMFARLFHPYLPGIRSLDNFYARQHDNGEICREIYADDGLDFLWWTNLDDDGLYSFFHRGWQQGAIEAEPIDQRLHSVRRIDLGREPSTQPRLTLDAHNNFVFAWAELLSFRQTGDIGRLERVFPPLYAYFQAVDDQLRHSSGFYATDWASMDNSPRNQYLGFGVDTACQMVLFAENLLDIAATLERHGRGTGADLSLLVERQLGLRDLVNEHMWDEQRQFYFDLDENLERSPVRTIAAFWALISGVAPIERAHALVRALEDPDGFARVHMVPTVPADEPDFDPEGGYWRGAVWAPTNQMVVAGLDRYGLHDLARRIAHNHVDALARIHDGTGTVYECSAPDHVGPGDNNRRDFIGWSGIGPIGFFVSHVVGVTADAEANCITWQLPERQVRVGIDNYWFFGKQADLVAEPTGWGWTVRLVTDDEFILRVVSPSGRVETRQINGDSTFWFSAE
ncbi:MGH1-like glycoside hydrolase domain-containing protein [Aestuariimicrobium ganziense]|uniref:MGH1-like glycoside hydrolase domain-containing protein n=1 Tax=Aestuariimicrobium ganziense TaxID=2773677 RepID=UPI0019451975|nr:trehalase family glycosidase [Aestuariimicrobium ganziense]